MYILSIEQQFQQLIKQSNIWNCVQDWFIALSTSQERVRVRVRVGPGFGLGLGLEAHDFDPCLFFHLCDLGPGPGLDLERRLEKILEKFVGLKLFLG
jgi:hypothetical protein